MSENRTKTVAKPPAETKVRKPVKHPPRPVEGPIDHEALYEKITRRFDKALARLAERD